MVRQLAATALLMFVCSGSLRPQTSTSGASETAASGPGAEVRSILGRQLPVLNGSSLRIKLLEVTYPPGGASAPHSHPCPVVGYVVSGMVRMRVKGGSEQTYKAGQSFYEAPNGIHDVSANASDREPAKFLAYFVCDTDASLSVPVPSGGAR